MMRSIERRSNCAQKDPQLLLHGRLKTGKPFGDSELFEHEVTWRLSYKTADVRFTQQRWHADSRNICPPPLELEKTNRTSGILECWLLKREKNLASSNSSFSFGSKNQWFWKWKADLSHLSMKILGQKMEWWHYLIYLFLHELKPSCSIRSVLVLTFRKNSLIAMEYVKSDMSKRCLSQNNGLVWKWYFI